jgi:hypothetical protein
MLYALLCYGCEDEIASMDARDERAMVDRCVEAARSLPPDIVQGPALRLMPTSTAITLRPGKRARTLDGPYSATREQLLGLWIFDCDSLDDAMTAARRIAEARGMSGGALEVRPIAQFQAVTRPELTLT